MNIVFLDAGTLDFGDVDLGELEALGNIVLYDFTSQADAMSRVQHADILIVNKFKINADVLMQAPGLKYITVAATGYNNVDLSSTKEKNILVSNVKGYSTSSVAQHLFAALLAVQNRSEYYFNEVNNERWNLSLDFCFYDHSVEEIYGKTMGIAGYGAIGQSVAAIAAAFGMEVLVLEHKNINTKEKYKIVNFEYLMEHSDVLTLHLPLNEKTRSIISAENLYKMKKNAILINTGRGPLINEEELAQHLKENPEFKAILDVLIEEPPSRGNLLIGLPNCHITPHIAWASRQARQRLIHGLAHNIRSFQQGMPVNLVS
jgi:glycerate dehydrogenase